MDDGDTGDLDISLLFCSTCHSIKTVLSIVVYLKFADYNMTVMMIYSVAHATIFLLRLTDYNDDL